MSAFSGTPGPWTVHCLHSQEWVTDAPNGDPTLGFSGWNSLVVVYGCDDQPEAGRRVAEANAWLIAAAPALLDAAKAARGALAAAIRSAWGDGDVSEHDVSEHVVIKALDAAIRQATEGDGA